MDDEGSRQQAHAASLREAEHSGKPIPPLTESDPGLDIAAAYEIQRLTVQAKLDAGRRIVGRKVGLTSRAMQEMLGVAEPDYGVIFDDMLVESGSVVDIGRLIQPRIEAEIAFVMEHDLAGPGIGLREALAAVGQVLPALEVIDSRIDGWRITLADTVADNASSALVVLGQHPLAVEDLDLRLAGVAVSRNDEVVEVGAGAAALGHPAACVAWLANKLAEFGEGLRAGDVVMPGALHRAITVNPGDAFVAEFAWLGTVSVRFSTFEEGSP